MRNRHSLTAIAALTTLLRTSARASAFVLPPYRAASSSVAAAAATSRFDLQPKGNHNSWAVTVKSTPATAGSATTATGEAITNADEAKRNLKQVLEKHFKKTTEEDVVTAIEILSGFNPTKDPAKAWHLLNGDWLGIGYKFPGVTTTPEGLECTLGRLAFNIFEPLSLPIRIVRVDNILRPSKSSSNDGDSENSYDAINHFCSLDGSGLRGKVVLKGSYTTDPKNSQRLLIRFFSGRIEPDDSQDLEAWRKVIGLSGFSYNHNEPAKKSKFKAFASVRKKATNLMLKLAFGFKPPASEPGSGGELSYEMTRSPKGWLDILYLDEEMRVTRGNRGSVAVVTRM